VIKLNSESLPMSAANGSDFHQLTVYPNPAHDVVQVQWPSSATTRTGWHLHLVDALGRTVLQKAITGLATEPIEIAVKDYPPGLYILRIEGPKGSVYSQRLAIN